jgi:hypothetical protein
MVGVLGGALVGSKGLSKGSTFTPVSGDAHWVIVDPGKVWIDEEGIQHIRDAVMEWEFLTGEGDLVGSGWGIYNMNIDPLTGEGDTQGFHYLDLSFGPLSGTFAGHADCVINGFVMAGDYIAHGDGGFEGMKLKMGVTLVFGSGMAEYDGILHDPKGK